jgi:hypothetical protein
MTGKRDRSKPKHDALKRALDAVLADKGQLLVLAVASIDSDQPGVSWDEDGPSFDDPADWDAQIKEVEDRLRHLQSLLARIPSQKKKSGGQALPGEPDLTELDKTILRQARGYAARTGKAAANGAVGPHISNQGGPFVKEVAAKICKKGEALETVVGRIIARIDRMEKHPRLNTLWNQARDPNWSEKTFREAISNPRLTG